MEKIDVSLYDDKYEVVELPNDFEDMSAYAIYSRIIRQFPVLKAGREYDLFVEYREHGNLKAKEELINCNLRLVTYLARKRAIYCKRLDVEDLIQEGNITLIRALDSFDYNCGYRFSTFLSRAVKSTFTTAIYKYDRVYRIPSHLEVSYGKILKAFDSLQKSDNDVTLENVSFVTGIKIDKIKKILRHVQDEIFLDKKFDEDDSRSYSIGDMIVDETAIELQEIFIKEEMKEKFYKSLEKLTYKEKSLLQALYLDVKPRSIMQVAMESNINIEKIKEMEKKALVKLSSFEELKDYIGEFV